MGHVVSHDGRSEAHIHVLVEWLVSCREVWFFGKLGVSDLWFCVQGHRACGTQKKCLVISRLPQPYMEC